MRKKVTNAKHLPAINAPASGKRFRITDTRTGEDVLGGPVGEANPYVSAYSEPVNKDDKHPRDLDVGASVLRRYRLSGSTGVYRVVRIEDATTAEVA